MPTYLLATASVHVTAAAADYLGERLSPTDDEVVVVGVREASDGGAGPETTVADPDAGDAANVARSRLAAVGPTIDLRDGDPVEEILAAVAEHDPAVVVIGSHGGTGESAALGSTATALLTDLDRPVVVVDPTP